MINAETINNAVDNCKWKSDNRYGINGKKNLHKGICTARGCICERAIDKGVCPLIINIVRDQDAIGMQKRY